LKAASVEVRGCVEVRSYVDVRSCVEVRSYVDDRSCVEAWCFSTTNQGGLIEAL
jgi:hypothetical protein